MSQKLEPIETLPNNGVNVLLLRRTSNNTVKSCVGFRSASGAIIGWSGARPPSPVVLLLPPASARTRPGARGTKP